MGRNLLLGLLLGMALMTPRAEAFQECYCAKTQGENPEKVRKALNAADAVFSGIVLYEGIAAPSADMAPMMVSVKRVWKGSLGQIARIWSPSIAISDGHVITITHDRKYYCRLGIRPGMEMLFYARRITFDGIPGYDVGDVCGRTSQLHDADGDLRVLGEGQLPVDSAIERAFGAEDELASRAIKTYPGRIPSFSDQVQEAEVIFVGTVTSVMRPADFREQVFFPDEFTQVHVIADSRGFPNISRIQFRASRVYKGSIQPTVEVWTSAPGYEDEYYFSPSALNEEYLVYASNITRSNGSSLLWTHRGTRTNKTWAAIDDLFELGLGTAINP